MGYVTYVCVCRPHPFFFDGFFLCLEFLLHLSLSLYLVYPLPGSVDFSTMNCVDPGTGGKNKINGRREWSTRGI